MLSAAQRPESTPEVNIAPARRLATSESNPDHSKDVASELQSLDQDVALLESIYMRDRNSSVVSVALLD